MEIFNITRIPQHVGFINPDTGEKAKGRIMPRGRVNPPDGMTIDKDWVARNPGIVKIIEDQVAPEAVTTPSVVVEKAAKKVAEPADDKKAAEGDSQ